MKDEENIVPQELVDAGVRNQKTVGERKKELDEMIETKTKMLDIIKEMIAEEETEQSKSEES